ncbi:MAG: hypothetical protein KGL39_56725 [Patescibacteria group bacterium]|nr:hypothetical protein [Patescibacteria group bacterium]
MHDNYKLSRQLLAEAHAAGQRFHEAYYLFESYEDLPDWWPQRSECEDLVFEHFCCECAFDRVREAFRAGLPVNDPDKDWYDHKDELYSGPTRDHDQTSDSVRWCLDCGKLLTFTPTEYCCDEELDVYERCEEIRAMDLLVLSEVLDATTYTDLAERAAKVTTTALQHFTVPAGCELRQRLPTWAKIKAAFKRACEPVYFAWE